jgi:hypothetical protein
MHGEYRGCHIKWERTINTRQQEICRVLKKLNFYTNIDPVPNIHFKLHARILYIMFTAGVP